MGRQSGALVIAAAVAAVLGSATFGNTTDSWLQPASGAWSTATNWSGGIPTSSSDVVIAAPGSAYTVETGLSPEAQAASVTVNSSDAYLSIGNLRTSLLDVEAGTAAVAGTLFDARVQGPGVIQVGNLGAVSNVTVASSLTFYGVATAYGNLTLDGGTVHLGGSTSLQASGTIQLSNLTGTGQVVFDGLSGSAALSESAQISTLAGNSILIGADVSLTNGRGEIGFSGSVTNAGSITVLPDHYLVANGSFVNNGSLTVDQGTAVFNAAMTTTDLGNFTRTGGKMIFNALLSVPGGILDLDSAFRGDVTLTGSTDATQVTGSANRTLSITAPQGGVGNSLDFTFLASSVTVSTEMFIVDSSGQGAATFAGDAVLDHHNITLEQGSNLYVGGNLTGNGNLVLHDGWAGVSGQPTSVLAGAANSTLTIGPGVTVQTNTVNSNASAQIGAWVGFDNKGVISAEGGSLTLTGSGWKNEGIINLDSGVLYLGGSTRTADLGTINRTGGSLFLSGLQLDNSNATLSLDAAHGDWDVLSAAVHGGTILSAGGSLTVVNQGHLTLDGVTLAGDFSTSLIAAKVTNGLTLSSAVVRISGLGFEGDQAISGDGTLDFAAPNGTTAVLGVSNGTLTIASGVTVRTDSSDGLVGNYDGSFGVTNDGTISSGTPHGTLKVLCGTMTNLGTLSATNGGVLAISNLVNEGLVSAEGSTLQFSGSFSNAGDVTASNSTVTFNSTFNNTGNMVLSNTTVILNYYDPNQHAGNVTHTGGTIFAATVHDLSTPVDVGATPFGPAAIGNGSSFSNVTIVDSAGPCNLLAGNTTTFNATLACNLVMEPGSGITGSIGLQNACISMSPSSLTTNSLAADHLSGTGVVQFDGSGGTSVVAAIGTGSMTIDAGVTIRTGANSGTVGASGTTTVNEGLISAETPGCSISLAGNITNNGTLSASNGGRLVLSGNLTNNGRVVLDHGTVVLSALSPLGGTLLNNGGSVLFAGTVSGSPSVLDLTDPFWGQVDLGGANLSNVTLNSSGGTPTIRTGVGSTVGGIPTAFSNVTLGTDLKVAPGATLWLSGSAPLVMGGHVVQLAGTANTTATLSMSLGGYLSGSGVVEFDGDGAANQIQSQFGISIQPNIVVRSGESGGTIAVPNLTVYGQVLSLSSSGKISIQGTATIVSGAILQATNGGAFQFSTSVQNSGTLYIDALSSMVVEGRFTQTSKGIMKGAGVLNVQSLSGVVDTPLTINITGNTVNVLTRLLLAGQPDAWTGKVNLGVADMIVRSTTGDTSTLANQLRQGFDGGASDGAGGITASASGTGGIDSGLALLTGADYLAATGSTTFQGLSYSPTDILLMHAIPGDANLDGQVDATDLNLVLSNFGKATSSWTAGNFVYDPTIDLSDLSTVLNNMGIGTAATAGTTSGTSVPEPASLGVMALGLLGLLKRRRS